MRLTREAATAAIAAVAEQASGAVGLAARHLESGESLCWREAEPFGTASMIKVAIHAAVLRRARAGQFGLDDQVTVRAGDIAGGSGVLAELRPGLRCTISDLCTLMIVVSDNTATNMLIALCGGVGAVNDDFAALGFPGFRLNRPVSIPPPPLAHSGDAGSVPVEPGAVDPASVNSGPAGSAPVGSAPVGSAPVGSAAVDPPSINSGYVGSAAAGPAAVDPASVNLGPVGSAPAGPAAVDPASVNSGPVGSAAVDPAPVNSAPVGPAAVEPYSVNSGSVTPGLAGSGAAPSVAGGPAPSAPSGPLATVSLGDFCELMAGLHAGTVVDEGASARIIEVLRYQQHQALFPRAYLAVASPFEQPGPGQPGLAHKTGYVSGCRTDGGLLFLPDGGGTVAYAAAADGLADRTMTALAEGDEILGRLGAIVLARWWPGPGPVPVRDGWLSR